jgi:hypothetical protein
MALLFRSPWKTMEITDPLSRAHRTPALEYHRKVLRIPLAGSRRSIWRGAQDCSRGFSTVNKRLFQIFWSIPTSSFPDARAETNCSGPVN